MSKPIIIIDAFLNSNDRINHFADVLINVKKLNLPILLISNSTIPIEIQNKVDYFIYDKQNALFEHEYDDYDMTFYWFENENFKYENYVESKQKHGLSVLCNLTKSCEFIKKLGYDKFIRFEWDFFIHDDDLITIKNLIHSFIINNENGFFITKTRDSSKGVQSEFAFHFWMTDLNFWFQNVPSILNEDDYEKFIFSKNKNKKFEIVERFLFLAFENVINKISTIEDDFFVTKLLPKSSTNKITSYANFSAPHSEGVFRGLSKVFSNNNLTEELVLFTRNINKSKKDLTEYHINFKDSNLNFTHITESLCWNMSPIANFNFSKFPITLKTNHGYEKTYHNVHDIKSFLIKK